MRKLFILAFSIASFISYAQDRPYLPFQWSERETVFKAVSMDFKEDKKPMFKGYKDSEITFTGSKYGDPKISVKMSGYFKIENGITKFNEYKRDQYDGETIMYSIDDGDQYCNVTLYYSLGKEKPDFIIVTATKNIRAKPVKLMTFTIEDFE
jgi:hypothetical protein